MSFYDLMTMSLGNLWRRKLRSYRARRTDRNDFHRGDALSGIWYEADDHG